MESIGPLPKRPEDEINPRSSQFLNLHARRNVNNELETVDYQRIVYDPQPYTQ